MKDRGRVLSAGLAFAAGFVEAVCFVGLFHTFVTYITGTLLVMTIDLVQGDPGALAKSVTFGSFFAFTLMWVTLSRLWPFAPALRLGALLVLEGVLIGLFALVGHLASPLASADALGTYVVSVFGVFAMSLHGMIFFQLLAQSAPAAPHFMTGNLTNFSRALVDIVLVDRFKAPLGEDERDMARFRSGFVPVVFAAFTAGAAGGVFALNRMGLGCLVLPGIAVVGLGVRELWRARVAAAARA